MEKKSVYEYSTIYMPCLYGEISLLKSAAEKCGRCILFFHYPMSHSICIAGQLCKCGRTTAKINLQLWGKARK